MSAKANLQAVVLMIIFSYWSYQGTLGRCVAYGGAGAVGLPHISLQLAVGDPILTPSSKTEAHERCSVMIKNILEQTSQRPDRQMASYLAPAYHNGDFGVTECVKAVSRTSTPGQTGLFEFMGAVEDTHINSSLAALYTKPSQLPRHTYDYVIIGAGNAGNVIASRLSEDPQISILVLEAGISNGGVIAGMVPLLVPTLTPNTPYDWNYTVVPQKGLNGRTIPYNRGRILGGCSSVNYMIHQYGSSEDYDKIANITGDAGWNWDSVKRNIGKHEKIVPPADGHDTSGQYTPANHGTNGMLPVSLPGSSQLIDSRVIATTCELSEEFPFNEDMGGGDVLGLGWIQSSISDGRRTSSATTYLAAAIKRPNVHVLLNAQVTKLVHTGSVKGVPSFRSVEFASGPGAPSTIVTARREIVLSAGSIGTPQILLLSGIGPTSELEALGIPVVVENPSVGKNLSDHVLVPNIFHVRDGENRDPIFQNHTLFKAALDKWMETKQGVLAGSIGNHLGFFRLPGTSSIFSTTPDPASGPKASHWELFVINFYLHLKPGDVPPQTGSYLNLVSILISPTSRGSVSLASADPFAHPLIDPNYFTTPFDIYAMRETVRAVKRFAGAKAWKDYVIAPYGNFSSNVDADLDAYIRDQASTVYHPVGTASMSPRGAEWGVVDPDLKVKGAEGIRIVDASVLPFPPNAHTQGPVYLLAEKAAKLFAPGSRDVL